MSDFSYLLLVSASCQARTRTHDLHRKLVLQGMQHEKVHCGGTKVMRIVVMRFVLAKGKDMLHRSKHENPIPP